MDLDIGSLAAGIKDAVGLGKGATDLALNLKRLLEKPGGKPDATRELVSELLDHLIRLQAQQIAMQGTILQFHEEQRRLERFQAEADRYVLKRTEQGSFVRELKAAYADKEPVHCICAGCYDKQIKSVLQPVAPNTFECRSCGTKVFMPDGQDNGAKVVPVNRGRLDGRGAW